METDTGSAPTEFDAVAAFRSHFAADGDTEAQPKATPAEEDSDEEDAEAQTAPDDDAAETDADEAEVEDEDGEEDGDDEKPKVLDPQTDKATVRIKVGDNVEEVPLDELSKSYLRQADYTRKSQALSETRKEVEATRQAVRGERDTYAGLIEALTEKLTQLESTDKVDWDKLYETDPIAYMRAREVHREREDHQRAARAEKQRIEAERAAEAQQSRSARIETTFEQAVNAVPAWKSEKVWERDRTAIMAYAKEQGFTAKEINDVCSTDVRVLLAMHHAAQHQRLMTNKPKPNAATASTPVMRSNKAAVTPQIKTETDKAKLRLQRSGKLSDAAALFKHLF